MAARKNPLVDKAYKLYKDGMKLVDIAGRLNCSAATIRTWKNRYKWDDNGCETFQKKNETKRNVSKGKDTTARKKLTPKRKHFKPIYWKWGQCYAGCKNAWLCESGAGSTRHRLLMNANVSERIAEQMERIEKEQHRDIMSLAEIQERRSLIAKGKVTDDKGYPDFAVSLRLWTVWKRH